MEEKNNVSLNINEEYLEELISLESSKLVGKIMKRYEICANPEYLKKEVKELIYESFRDLRDLLLAHNCGLKITTFKFKTKENSLKE